MSQDRELGYGAPLETQTVEWLAAEVRMLHGQIRTLERDHRISREADRAEAADMHRLVIAANDAGHGRGGGHDATCWMRHVYCLTRYLRWRPDEIAQLLNPRGGSDAA